MKNVKRIAEQLVSGSTLLLIALLAGCTFMSHTRCDDNILGKEKSPDGRFVAVTYTRSCANNTGQYTWVGLKEASQTANREAEPVVTIIGVHDIKAFWRSPTNLEIESTGLSDVKNVLTRKDSWGTVSISYKDPPP